MKNWLWTVIFSIILTDDRFPSLGFHPVCVGDKRKNRCPECLHIIFHDIVIFFWGGVSLPEIYTINRERERERRPEGMHLCFFLGELESQDADENE